MHGMRFSQLDRAWQRVLLGRRIASRRPDHGTRPRGGHRRPVLPAQQRRAAERRREAQRDRRSRGGARARSGRPALSSPIASTSRAHATDTTTRRRGSSLSSTPIRPGTVPSPISASVPSSRSSAPIATSGRVRERRSVGASRSAWIAWRRSSPQRTRCSPASRPCRCITCFCVSSRARRRTSSRRLGRSSRDRAHAPHGAPPPGRPDRSGARRIHPPDAARHLRGPLPGTAVGDPPRGAGAAARGRPSERVIVRRSELRP